MKNKVLRKIKSNMKGATNNEARIILTKIEMQQLCGKIDKFENEFDESLSLMEKVIKFSKKIWLHNKMQWESSFHMTDDEKDIVLNIN